MKKVPETDIKLSRLHTVVHVNLKVALELPTLSMISIISNKPQLNEGFDYLEMFLWKEVSKCFHLYGVSVMVSIFSVK